MDEVAKLQREVAHLRATVTAIKQATLDGRICSDVAWFSDIETLHDFCEHALEWSPEQKEMAL